MVNDKSWFPAVGFFYVLFFRIIDLRFFLSSGPGIISGQLCRFLKSAVGQSIPVCFYDHMGTGKAFGMEPPIVTGSKTEGQFIVLQIVFSNINVVSVAADIMERTARDLNFFITAFPADITVLNKFFYYIFQNIFLRFPAEPEWDPEEL